MKNAAIKGKHNIKYRKYIYDEIYQYSDVDDCKNHPYFGELTSEVLNSLLCSKFKRFNLELANWALRNFSGPNTVDFYAFRKIMRLRGKLGKSMRMCLPHVPLAFYQLYELAKTNEGGMALDSLLPIMCDLNIFTNEDIVEILVTSKATLEMKKLAISFTKQKLGVTAKTIVMETVLAQVL